MRQGWEGRRACGLLSAECRASVPGWRGARLWHVREGLEVDDARTQAFIPAGASWFDNARSNEGVSAWFDYALGDRACAHNATRALGAGRGVASTTTVLLLARCVPGPITFGQVGRSSYDHHGSLYVEVYVVAMWLCGQVQVGTPGRACASGGRSLYRSHACGHVERRESVVTAGKGSNQQHPGSTCCCPGLQGSRA